MGATRGAGGEVYARRRRSQSRTGAVPVPYPHLRRIRLVAYGARLERGLGETPRGFKSRILRGVARAAVSPSGLACCRIRYRIMDGRER